MLRVGVVARPHGVRGEIAVTLDDPDSESLLLVERVAIGEGPFRAVRAARRGRRGQAVIDVGLSSPEEAAALRGAEVRVEEADLPPLGEHEYWHRDLLGLRAVLADGTELGRVEEIADAAEVPVLVVRGRGEEVFVPFADPFVIEVDVPGGRVVVAPPAE